VTLPALTVVMRACPSVAEEGPVAVQAPSWSSASPDAGQVASRVAMTETLQGTGAAARLAERWSRLRLADVPKDAVEVARHCVLDWLGCALAGSTEPAARILRDVLDTGEAGTCSLVGRTDRAAARTAAVVNGTAGHALDFDDTHTTLMGHPTAPVLPAVLALAEERSATGAELLAAVVAGIEVECRVGALFMPRHYEVGWHATATLGTVGAAAGCAHLLGLDAARFATALGLAATQAAGLKSSFGTMAKPLHAGKAAADGLLAARLAEAGFTGSPAALDGHQGLGEATTGSLPDAGRLDRLDGRFLVRDTLFKRHAACYLTHAAINAAASLRGAARPDEVESVEVRVAPAVLDVCNIAEPATGLEAKFSLRATVAMALLGDDTTDHGAFTDARATAPELVALRDRVTVVTEPGRPGTAATVVVTTASGDRLQGEADTGRPADDLATQAGDLGRKFLGLAGPVLGTARSDAALDAARHLDQLGSVRELTALLVP